MILRKCSAQAVSYTHLDVYKRQVHKHTEAPKECQFPRGFFVGVGLALAFVLAI